MSTEPQWPAIRATQARSRPAGVASHIRRAGSVAPSGHTVQDGSKIRPVETSRVGSHDSGGRIAAPLVFVTPATETATPLDTLS
eukprot:387383-Pyramimonas_sp.AAC.2